jgi:CubicO group peptidase (beta-lactamase class C family)
MPGAALVRVPILVALGLVLLQQLPALEPRPDVHLVVSLLGKRALERPIAGLSIALARSGVVFESRSFGLADVDRQTPVGPQTIFHVDSVSKNIGAAVMLRLAEQGRLSLDDDIATYVPEAPTGGRHVTIRQLLTHTSGLFSVTSVPDAEANELRDLSHAQVLDLIRGRPPDFAPGTSWRYSNTGFYLVGMAVERITGMSYAAYLREQVFAPLGMASSSLCTATDDVPGLARGYDVRAGTLAPAPPASWALPFAGGGVCSTAEDLLRWQQALDAGRFISPSHLAEMRTATMLVDGTRIDYGLGTRLGSLQGHTVVGHTGSGNGFSAVLETFPADHLTVVVLSNTSSANAATIAAAIARSALELAPVARNGSDVPADEAAALTGRFDSDEGTIENYACGRDLCFRLPGTPNGQPLVRLAPFLYAVDADTEVRFSHPPSPVEWGIVSTGGLFADAKRRIH